MKIAYLAPYSPRPLNFGGAFHIEALWRAFSSIGQVRLLVMGDDPPGEVRKGLEAQGVAFFPSRKESKARKVWRYLVASIRGRAIPASRFLWPSRISSIVSELEAFSPDVIVLGDSSLSTLIPHVRRLKSKIVVDTHNVESRLQARVLAASRLSAHKIRYFFLYENTRRIEQRFLPLADEVWAVSEDDARFFREHRDVRIAHHVPNVLDLSRYDTTTPEEDGAVVFTGWFEYWPNEDAALQLIRLSRELERKGISHRLYLVGRGETGRMKAEARKGGHIIITGEVEDARPYIARASVFAAPLRAGSGTKLKIIEALALQRAVLTTPVGAEGLQLTPDREIAIATDPESFESSLVKLLGDPRLRRELGSRGRQWVERHASLAVLREKTAVLLSRR